MNGFSNGRAAEPQPFPRGHAPSPSEGFMSNSSPLTSDGSSSMEAATGPPFRSAGDRTNSFSGGHQHTQSTSVLSSLRNQPPPSSNNNSSANTQRSSSMRPLSAFQPLDNPDYHSSVSPSSPIPPSPQGSTTRSIRPSAAQLTFKSQDLRSALTLQEAQQKKLYMEGYLLKRDDLGTDGKQLHGGDDKRRWTECFVQLSGTVLSLWNVQQMEDAASEGREVPPIYINITDSFVDFIGLWSEDPSQVPASRGRYHHAFALNSAGNNRTIFCFRDPPPFSPETIESWLAPENRQKPEHRAVIGWLNLGHRYLQAWINAIRLASWEKVRLEEIYTGALIRARLGAVVTSPPAEAQKDSNVSEMIIKSPLTKGKMEGWVKARFMGSTEWKKCWMVLTDHKPDESEFGGKKKFWKLGGAGDRSSVMSVGSATKDNSSGNAAGELPPPPGNNGAPGVANFFDTKKSKKPFASLIYASHAFAVYPSRPELVEGSSLFKIEGVFPNSTVLSATHRVRTTGWVMLMPELEGAGSKGANAEMMKWVIAFMDSFKLYGRPEGFTWDARNPASAFFAYPIGPFKDRLFLDRELAEFLEISREDHLTSRTALHGIMSARMRGERTKILQPLPPPPATTGPSAPAAQQAGSNGAPELPSIISKLPPLDFSTSGESSDIVAQSAISEQPRELHQPASMQNGNSAQRFSMGPGFKDSELAPGQVDPTQQQQLTSEPAPEADRPAREARPGQFLPTRETGYGSPRNPIFPATRTFSQSSVSAPGPAAMTTTTLAPAIGGANGHVSPRIPPKSSARPTDNVSPRQSNEPSTSGRSFEDTQRPDTAGSAAPSYRSSALLTSSQNEPAPKPANPALVPQAPAPVPVPVPRQPAVLGPSGRGAEQSEQQQKSMRPVSDLPGSYDEGALFYMASISDQLPAAPPAPVKQPVQELAPAKLEAPSEATFGREGTSHSATASASTHASSYRAGPPAQSSLSYAAPAAAPTQASAAVEKSNNNNAYGEDSIGDDALAAYSFLQQPSSPVVNTRSLPSQAAKPAPQETLNTPAQAPAAVEKSVPAPSVVQPGLNSYPSTFGQNKRAAERKTAAQLQAQAHQEALSRPGRPGGKRRTGSKGAHAWGEESSEEEEEEEEEEDDDENDRRSGAGRSSGAASRIGGATDQNVRSLQPTQTSTPSSAGQSGYGDLQLPYGGSVLSGHDPTSPRSRSISPGQAAAQRGGHAHPALQGAQRQSVFNSHLGAGHGDDSYGSTPPQTLKHQDRQTFLQLNPEEQPGAMTTVFTPHGLVQAGAQDKAERSAKAQEAEARMMGSHLVSVPNKPPPPQAGLLGAITAHERDRKAAGGYGATLTERERERVAAERRQREEDMLRQQQQQMQQMAYYNPMMFQQMMMGGMMPGMGMGMGMGMPGMAGYAGSQMGGQMGFDPMMAQQQAMQAAQMAYMNAMSQAHEGSVIGHGSPQGVPASAMGMPMGSMAGMSTMPSMSPYMANSHVSMMGAPYPGFMANSPAGIGSEYRGSPPPRPGSTRVGTLANVRPSAGAEHRDSHQG